MKNLCYLLIAIALLLVIFPSCKKEIPTTSQTYDTMDRFNSTELKWIDYQQNSKIRFKSNQSIDSIIFVFKSIKTYNYYQSYHMAILGGVYFVNVNQEQRITNLQIAIDKNSSSARVGGIMSNVIGFELYNSKAAIGMFPSVSASSRPFTISEDIRDTNSFVLPSYKNFTVNNKSYQNVYKLQMQFNKNIGATFLYVNRDFGFLRIDFEDGEVWERVL